MFKLPHIVRPHLKFFLFHSLAYVMPESKLYTSVENMLTIQEKYRPNKDVDSHSSPILHIRVVGASSVSRSRSIIVLKQLKNKPNCQKKIGIKQVVDWSQIEIV